MGSINIDFIKQLRDDYNNYQVFIETGTLNGDSTFSLEPYFNELHTIELSEYYYYNTKARYNGNKINFYLGDSTDVLKEILPNIKSDTIFFLDGHYSSGGTAQGNKDCPLIEEIENINNLFDNKAIIIIDDLRLFGKDKSSGILLEDWSEISEDKIKSILTDRITDYYYLDSNHTKNDRLIIHISNK